MLRPMETIRIDTRTRDLVPLLRMDDAIGRASPGHIRRSMSARIEPYKPIHPFYRHGEAAHFAVRRGRRFLGRMSAIADGRLEGRIGWFGLVACHDDPRALGHLLDAAAGFLRSRGIRQMMGPVDLTIWHACRIQTAGPREPRYFVEPPYPAYLADHLLGHGLRPTRRFECHEYRGVALDEDLERSLDERVRTAGYRLRALRPASIESELELLRDLAARCFPGSMGFVPLSRREFHLLYGDLAQHVPPQMVCIAESRDGQPVGFALSMPDLSGVLRRLGGRTPVATLRAAWARRRISAMLFKTVAVLPEHRESGLASAMAARTHREGLQLGYTTSFQGFFDVDNEPSVRASARALRHRGARTREYAIVGTDL